MPAAAAAAIAATADADAPAATDATAAPVTTPATADDHATAVAINHFSANFFRRSHFSQAMRNGALSSHLSQDLDLVPLHESARSSDVENIQSSHGLSVSYIRLRGDLTISLK